MPLTKPSPDQAILDLVRRALEEDAAAADATTQAVVPAQRQACGRIVAKASGVVAGRAYADAAFALCDPGLQRRWAVEDGSRVRSGNTVLEVQGAAAALLAAERTALNFLQQLSGVATATAIAVAAAGEVQVLDTRKTVPGLRHAQKQAVLAGGGVNHRRDLSDQLLLKENHFALSGMDYAATVAAAVAAAGGRLVGAEAQDFPQAVTALENGADYVLLDNFEASVLPRAVEELRSAFPDAILEASGGFTPETVARLGDTGVSRVSLGALTHSASALDFSFLLEVGDGALS